MLSYSRTLIALLGAIVLFVSLTAGWSWIALDATIVPPTSTAPPHSGGAPQSTTPPFLTSGTVSPAPFPPHVVRKPAGTAAFLPPPTSAAPAAPAASSPLTAQAAPLSIRVAGNDLVNQGGSIVQLRGVNRPGMDALHANDSCLTTQSFANVNAMTSWHINAVRIPLNEDCWLGINGPSVTMMTAYSAGVQQYVAALNSHAIYAILDLHRSAPGSVPATEMQAMPDADHALLFWSSVATTFIHDKAVIFDPFNEPHLADVMTRNSNYWLCWRDGCSLDVVYVQVSGRPKAIAMKWQAAGMQQLVDAVRQTGAKQPLMVEGLGYGNRLSATSTGPISWLTYTPVDPIRQLIASPHVYNADVACVILACWNQQYRAVARQYPVVTGELGEDDCSVSFVDAYMQFADAAGISYLAWEWTPQKTCVAGSSSYGLISDWAGDPSPIGAVFNAHFTSEWATTN